MSHVFFRTGLAIPMMIAPSSWARALAAFALLVLIPLAPASEAGAADKRDYDSEIAHYKGLADGGNQDAQEELALIYSEAATKPGTTERETPPQTRQYAEARRLLAPLVEAKRPKAMARLATLESFGLGGPVNHDRARDLAEDAADSDVPEAQWLLARIHISGRGVEPDQEAGLELLAEAIDQGYWPAIVDQATITLTNAEEYPSQRQYVSSAILMVEAALRNGEERAAKLLFVPFDYNTIGPRYFWGDKELLDSGGADRHPAILHYLGLLYYFGSGVPQSNDEAFRWTNWAAQAEYAPAQFDLAVYYLRGVGVAVDEDAAVKWLDRAAANGHAQAKALRCDQHLYGGPGGTVDVPRALKLCREAADAGDADAIFALGLLHDAGMLGPANLEQAVSFYRQAADLGHPGAQQLVGISYQFGRGVADDLVESVRWFRRAAAQGDARAQLRLGFALLNGLGVTPDKTEAYVMLSLALKSEELRGKTSRQEDLAWAKAAHDELAKTLRRDRLEYADALIKAYKPSYEKRNALPRGFAPWEK